MEIVFLLIFLMFLSLLTYVFRRQEKKALKQKENKKDKVSSAA